jgi:lipoprotein-anchoring transpeptidase ErfK/SrfK
VSPGRIFLIGAFAVFSVIGAAAWWKKGPASPVALKIAPKPVEIPLAVTPPPLKQKAPPPSPKPSPQKAPPSIQETSAPALASTDLPVADRISQLFALDSSKLPIVETVSYTSRVPWIQGRPAWLADYASHYSTSRHFIARSLNRKCDYLTQKVAPGDRFNVFRKDKNFQFHLVIDLSKCRMWFYYNDLDANERVLLKTYPVGIGRVDATRASGFLTPIGKYQLGEKVAIYKPGTMGTFQEQKTEMIRVFGTRWIPFEKEVEGCTESARGYGLHGVPWIEMAGGELVEDKTKLGKYGSDGCIRLASEDIEEIFAIVLTKPTTVELVKDFRDAKLFGIEKISK